MSTVTNNQQSTNTPPTTNSTATQQTNSTTNTTNSTDTVSSAGTSQPSTSFITTIWNTVYDSISGFFSWILSFCTTAETASNTANTSSNTTNSTQNAPTALATFVTKAQNGEQTVKDFAAKLQEFNSWTPIYPTNGPGRDVAINVPNNPDNGKKHGEVWDRNKDTWNEIPKKAAEEFAKYANELLAGNWSGVKNAVSQKMTDKLNALTLTNNSKIGDFFQNEVAKRDMQHQPSGTKIADLINLLKECVKETNN